MALLGKRDSNYIVDDILLKFGGCLLIIIIIVFVWIVVSQRNRKKYYYKTSNDLSMELGFYAHRKHWNYSDEPLFYSNVLERLHRYIDIDNYFITHDINGKTDTIGRFNVFLCRTSYGSNRTFSNRSNASSIADDPLHNFTGIVLSYIYDIDFADSFVLLATQDMDMYDKSSLNYKFLIHSNSYKLIANSVWSNSMYSGNNQFVVRMANYFSEIYSDKLFQGTTIMAILDHRRITIFVSDANMQSAERISANLRAEVRKLKVISKFFQWAKNMYSNKHRSQVVSKNLDETLPEISTLDMVRQMDMDEVLLSDIKNKAKEAAKKAIAEGKNTKKASKASSSKKKTSTKAKSAKSGVAKKKPVKSRSAQPKSAKNSRKVSTKQNTSSKKNNGKMAAKKPATKTGAAKKTPVKKSASTKSSTVKKSTVAKPSKAKKSTTKRSTTAKKATTTKRTTTKKATATKPAITKKTPATKPATVKNTAATKTTAVKKNSVKKSSVKQSSAKKTGTIKTSTVKKTAAKKSVAKKNGSTRKTSEAKNE